MPLHTLLSKLSPTARDALLHFNETGLAFGIAAEVAAELFLFGVAVETSEPAAIALTVHGRRLRDRAQGLAYANFPADERRR